MVISEQLRRIEFTYLLSLLYDTKTLGINELREFILFKSALILIFQSAAKTLRIYSLAEFVAWQECFPVIFFTRSPFKRLEIYQVVKFVMLKSEFI